MQLEGHLISVLCVLNRLPIYARNSERRRWSLRYPLNIRRFLAVNDQLFLSSQSNFFISSQLPFPEPLG